MGTSRHAPYGMDTCVYLGDQCFLLYNFVALIVGATLQGVKDYQAAKAKAAEPLYRFNY
jgi:hypothetical protein